VPTGTFMKAIRDILLGTMAVVLSMSAAAQELIQSDRPTDVTGPAVEPTMMRVVPYPDSISMQPGVAPAAPYASCYRIGRCSANDLYRFRDRPNRLTRLAPQAPPPNPAAWTSNRYIWYLVPVTPVENILPRYRTASQVRNEYRAVGTPIDEQH
jgi:hypothetical protein